MKDSQSKMNLTLRVILLLLWIMLIASIVYFQAGPYAWGIDLQVKALGGFSPKTTNLLFFVLAFAPVIATLQDFPNLKRAIPILLNFLPVFCFLVSVGSFLKFRSVRNAPEFATLGEVVATARMTPTDFTYTDLVRQFNPDGMIQVTKRDGNKLDEIGIYIPAVAPDSGENATQALLLLSENEMKEYFGYIGKKAGVINTNQGFGRSKSKWHVCREPLPYLVRKGLQNASGAYLAVIIRSGNGAAEYWLISAVSSLVFAIILLVIALKESKLWRH